MVVSLEKKIEVFEKNGRMVAIIGHEYHGRPSFRLWVNKYIPVEEREEYGERHMYVSLKNTRIAPTKSQSPTAKNLIPAKGWNTVMVSVPAGYRGNSKFRVYRDGKDEGIEVRYSDYSEIPDIIITDDMSIAPFARFRSERGNLGIDVGAIISTTLPRFIIEWERSGRTYGTPKKGVSICYPEQGKMDTYEDIGIEDIEDIE